MRSYTKTHEWLETNGNVVKVGLTKQALCEIGEIVFIELPKVGKEVACGQEAVVVESTKAAVDICSPVSGTIHKTNEALKANLQLLNQSPEDSGWLFQVQLSDATK